MTGTSRAAHALNDAVAGHVRRVMRADGFLGTVEVTEVESTRGALVAQVIATVGAESAPYVATIHDGRVTIKRVH